MSCACTGEFHSTTPPTALEAKQIRKVRKKSEATDVEQDMDARGPDIVHTLHTVRLSRFETPYARALYSSQSGPCAYCASADPFAQILPSEVLHFVQETAHRLLQVVDGVFERSPTRLVEEITDDLLIEIRQAVISAGDAAQPKPLSRLAQKRLMLWVVVDAVRSPVVLSGAAADRVGGRIWKQAQRVSDALTATALQHASQRDAARVAAAADPSLEAGLAMKLAAITAAEEKRCNVLRREVYTGLYELDPVVPVPIPPPAGAVPITASTDLAGLKLDLAAARKSEYWRRKQQEEEAGGGGGANSR